MHGQTVVDDATRKAWEAGPFAKILRDAAADRRKKEAEAAARPALSAAVFVDENVSRDSVERLALARLVESAPDPETGADMLRDYARSQLRKTFRGVDWEHFNDLAYGPRLRQPSLPKPVGNGRDWAPPRRKPRPKEPVAFPRRRIDYAALTPLPGLPAYAAKAC